MSGFEAVWLLKKCTVTLQDAMKLDVGGSSSLKRLEAGLPDCIYQCTWKIPTYDTIHYRCIPSYRRLLGNGEMVCASSLAGELDLISATVS